MKQEHWLEMLIGTRAGIRWVLTVSRDDDGDNKSVDTEDTSHDNWNDGLEDQFWLEDGHTANTDATLGGSIGGSEVAEDERAHDSHSSEEESLVWISVDYNSISRLANASWRVMG